MNSSPPPVVGASDDESQATQVAIDPARAKRRRKLRRRAAGATLLLSGLVGAGVLSAVLTPAPQVAVADINDSALIQEGKQLYDQTCITCHGANLQGIAERGTSLIGVGEAAVYFQVTTGRMPAVRQEAQMPMRGWNRFTPTQVDALGAFVQANGGGPVVVRDSDGSIAEDSLIGDNSAVGGDLFRQNCASCHNFTGKGGTLSSGKYAPNLDSVTESQIYTAMLTGPENMPKFSDRQLTPEEKKDVVAYVVNSNQALQPGGLGLGGFGPAAEAGVIWAVGIVAVVGATLWIGSRS
ncbi:cytochrome bc1 complex diheme cytochrome c subunit [Tomitella biformata]|uniref:cytochrome bc1 complex diheme cytochrome c subunit n=1 Tax=Tomitella biformata TaxID=630403 RepID=UPI0004667C74|nr:cytochrome c [Tomitella biformata]